MSEVVIAKVVTAAVKLTFGFLANKIRSGIAERLKDSDVTDEECRRLIVRELDDIKSKLDGLARKDLLSSLCFLQEGIDRLYQSLFQLDSNEVTAKSTEKTSSAEAKSSPITVHNSATDDAVALVNAMASLKIRANDRFRSAIESFKLAREKATEAFCNEALSIEDRIQATQIRMMARILESLEDPDESVSDCLQYLKQVHDIKAIQETFSVLIHGGIKSLFNKTKRLDNASSVQLMNQILFEFARKFTKLLKYLQSCPMILCGEESYYPLFGDSCIVEKVKESGVQVMSPNLDFTFDDEISSQLSVVNSKGEILALTHDESSLKIFKHSGESRTLCEIPWETIVLHQCAVSMNIDAEDNIYLVTTIQKICQEFWSFKLFVFDENGNKKVESWLPFFEILRERVYFAVKKDGKMAILDVMEGTLSIGKICIEQNLFKVEKHLSIVDKTVEKHLFIMEKIKFSIGVRIMKIADFNSTKMIAADWDNLCIFAENGNLERKITLTCTISSVAINHAMKRILVKVHKSSTSDCTDLLSFSETGELMNRLNLGSSEWVRRADLISHANGPVALVRETGAILLHL